MLSYISSFMGGGQGGQEEREPLTDVQRDFVQKVRTNDGPLKHFDEHYIVDILCLSMDMLELSTLVPKKGTDKSGLDKKTEFISMTATFRV